MYGVNGSWSSGSRWLAWLPPGAPVRLTRSWRRIGAVLAHVPSTPLPFIAIVVTIAVLFRIAVGAIR